MTSSHLAVDDPSIPPPVSGLLRVFALETLGVTFADRLDFSGHFGATWARAARSTYVLRVLRAHGLQGEISGRFAEQPPSVTSLMQLLLGGVILTPVQTATSVCVEQTEES